LEVRHLDGECLALASHGLELLELAPNGLNGDDLAVDDDSVGLLHLLHGDNAALRNGSGLRYDADGDDLHHLYLVLVDGYQLAVDELHGLAVDDPDLAARHLRRDDLALSGLFRGRVALILDDGRVQAGRVDSAVLRRRVDLYLLLFAAAAGGALACLLLSPEVVRLAPRAKKRPGPGGQAALPEVSSRFPSPDAVRKLTACLLCDASASASTAADRERKATVSERRILMLEVKDDRAAGL